MCKRLIALALMTAAMLAAGSGAAQAQTPVEHSIYQRYIDPFASPGWEPARTDMGVDWPRDPPAPRARDRGTP